MRRVVISGILFLSMSVSLCGQASSEIEKILFFCGAASEEEADAEEVERLMDILSRPIPVNLVSSSRLISSGLFSSYQVASLKDYISTTGDVLSYSELAAVDGFSADFVTKLAPFISLESYSRPGKHSSDRGKVKNEIAVRSGVRKVSGEDNEVNYGMKYRVTTDERISASLSLSKAYADKAGAPSSFSGNLTWNFNRLSARLTAGDFNARFGQGLVLWNGMSISGSGSPSSFFKKGSGISGTWSFTGSSSFTGIAASLSPGRLKITAIAALPEIRKVVAGKEALSILPAVNIGYQGRIMNISATTLAQFSNFFSPDPMITDFKSSLDMALCIRGVDVFAEAAVDWAKGAGALISGTSFMAGEDMRMAFLARWYPPEYSSAFGAPIRSSTKTSNEIGAAVSGEFHTGSYIEVNGAEGFGSSVRRSSGTFSIDGVYHPEPKSASASHSSQIRVMLNWKWMISPMFRLSTRLNLRYRTWEEHRLRSDVRADLDYFSRNVFASLRVNAVRNKGMSLLSYMEGGIKTSRFAIYLRQGVFFIDDWDDRIYAYERDAPGSFNVPAYYGRGVWTALTASWKYARWGKMFLRASLTSYPFMDEQKKKPGKAELKLYLMFSL